MLTEHSFHLGVVTLNYAEGKALFSTTCASRLSRPFCHSYAATGNSGRQLAPWLALVSAVVQQYSKSASTRRREATTGKR